ncbi:MAG: hypothetical protein ACRYGK_12405 [Janthinobacterium lividum]
MEERVSYSEMRSWLLDSCYRYSKGKLMRHQNWKICESEIGYAYDGLSDAFDTPIENLMLEVLSIFLEGAGIQKQKNIIAQKSLQFLKTQI